MGFLSSVTNVVTNVITAPFTGGGGGGIPGMFGYAAAGSNPFLSNGMRNPYYG